MMTQTLLPYQYLNEKNESHLTAFAGLPLYLDMASGLSMAIEKHLTIKVQRDHSKVNGIPKTLRQVNPWLKLHIIDQNDPQ